jgi:gentisate 1,2-dioxygenase
MTDQLLSSWATVEHRAQDQADLFVLGDQPVLRALGLYREERPGGEQSVREVFRPEALA